MKVQLTGDFRQDYLRLVDVAEQWVPVIDHKEDLVSTSVRPFVQFFDLHKHPQIEIEYVPIKMDATLWERLYYLWTGKWYCKS